MNTQYQKQKFYLTSIGPSVLDVYRDKTGKKKLVLKEKGISLTGGTGATWSRSETTPFVRKITGIELTRQAPNSIVNYDYSVRIVKNYKHVAYMDNSEYWRNGKAYGDQFPYLTVSGGLFQDADAIAMEDKIITMGTLDKGFTRPADGAACDFRRAYTITDDDYTDASGFTVTWPDGTTTVFVTATTFAAGQLAIQFNAKTTAAYGGTAFNQLLKCYRIGAHKYLVTSVNPGLLFTIAGAVDTTPVKREILLDSRVNASGPEYSYDVEFPDRSFALKTQYNLIDLTSSDNFSAATNVNLGIDGTDNLITAGTNASTVAAAINAITSTPVYASYNTNKIYISTNNESTIAANSIVVSFPYANKSAGVSIGTLRYSKSKVSIAYYGSKTGAFSSLTAYDVFREFATMKHAGDLSTAIRLAQPTNEAHVKFTCNSVANVPSANGTGRLESEQVRVEIYVPKSVLQSFDLLGTSGNTIDYLLSDLQSSTLHDTATTTPDRTVEGLFVEWTA